MKRFLAVLLSATMLLMGCASNANVTIAASENSQNSSPETSEYRMTASTEEVEETSLIHEKNDEMKIEDKKKDDSRPSQPLIESKYNNIVPDVDGLDDPALLRYVEDNLYLELVKDLDNDEYFVENVNAIYISEEYLEELEYNSKSNIYFGYSLQELDEQFEGTRYIFTLGDDNTTAVNKFEEYDDTYQKVAKNVAVGAGVILICVTVSVVTAGAGAPAISMIFATGAKTGAVMAASSGALSGVATGIVTGIQTQNMSQALKAGALAGSKDFKWGAITGVIAGGATESIKYAKAMKALKGVSLNDGFSMQQAAAIQMESGYPVDVIKQFHSKKEYEIYKNAQLKTMMVDGKLALVKDIDLSYKSELPNGEIATNWQRMSNGYAPIDPSTGKAYELHHIGQKADGTLAVLKAEEHRGNAKILNTVGKETEINRSAFDHVRKSFWKSYAAAVGN